MKSKGDVGNKRLKSMQRLIELAYRFREECYAASVSRTTQEGLTYPVPGFDSRTMDWQLDVHSASGAVTDTIEEQYGKKTARKVHEVLAEYKPTSSLSPHQYKALCNIFIPAYWNVFVSLELIEELWHVCSGLEEQGVNRVERQQTYMKYMLHGVKEGSRESKEGMVELDEPPAVDTAGGLNEIFEKFDNSDLAHYFLVRWLERTEEP